jgi:hypothetical protein
MLKAWGEENSEKKSTKSQKQTREETNERSKEEKGTEKGNQARKNEEHYQPIHHPNQSAKSKKRAHPKGQKT